MSNPQVSPEIDEADRHKSGVVASDSPSAREQGFQKDAKVKMKVTEDGITQFKHFLVEAASQRSDTSWQYKLKTADGLLYAEGKWFREVDLKPRN